MNAEIPEVVSTLKLSGDFSSMALFNMMDIIRVHVDDENYQLIVDLYTRDRRETTDFYIDYNSGFLDKKDISTTMLTLGLDVERMDGAYPVFFDEYLEESSPPDPIKSIK